MWNFSFISLHTSNVFIRLLLLPCSKDVVPQFELKVELWSCSLEEELTLSNTPKKLAKKLRNSLGKSAGKKLCSLLDTPDPDSFLQDNPIPLYVFLYYTTNPAASLGFLSALWNHFDTGMLYKSEGVCVGFFQKTASNILIRIRWLCVVVTIFSFQILIDIFFLY